MLETTHDLDPVLQKLLEETPPENKGGLECQVVLMNGAAMAGALLRNRFEIPGVYCLRGLMRKGDARAGAPEMVDTYFSSRAVFSITLPSPQAELPRIVTPSSGGLRMG